MNMVENGMVVDREQYDPQEQPDMRPCRCALCGERFWPDEVTKVGLDYLYDYCMANGSEYDDDFISCRENDFYLSYWFYNLPEEDQVHIIKRAYEDKRDLAYPSELDQMKHERRIYLSEADGYFEYVRKRLKQEAQYVCQ